MTSLASPIFYAATDLTDINAGEDLWRYDYKVANETGIDIDFFAIYFDINDYDFNLVSTPFGDEIDPADYATPLGWTGIGLPDDEFFGDDGQFVFFQDSGLFGQTTAADAIEGFSMIFIWRGVGDPGSQFFEFFDDPFAFDPAGSSFTQLMQGPPSEVSEPATGLLFGLGLVALAGCRQRFLATRR